MLRLSSTRMEPCEDIAGHEVGSLLSRLPPIKPITDFGSLSCAYGAHWIAAEYCGMKRPPITPLGLWQHGWTPKYWAMDPAMVIGGWGSYEAVREAESFWVARRDAEEYLRQHGYRRVKAIGLPVAYVLDRPLKRVKGSLLVMPVHSLQTTTHKWNFEEYAEAIDAVKDKFSAVVVCLHQSCLERGYWVDAFQKRGFRVVQGAGNDRNALKRLQYLMSSFEYVTTNGFGTHLAFASFFGAKVSIYGPYAEFQKRDYVNTLLYREVPQILEPTLKVTSKAVVQSHYPFLFCEPFEAKENRDWGREEVGYSNRVPPEELRRLFGWSPFSLAKREAKSAIAKGMSTSLHICRHWTNLAARHEYREYYRRFSQVLKLPPRTRGTILLYDKAFRFVDGGVFLHLHREIIENQIYRFSTAEECPLIIDGGANIGLSVVYFKQLYPNSRILAFEPDPDIFQFLEENCRSFELRDVHLFKEALWKVDGTLGFRPEGAWGSRLAIHQGESSAVTVPTRRLRDLLRQRISLLKLDVEGAETDLLEDCADLLSNVENLFVEYHSFADQPQTLHRLLTIVHEAGFRVHFHTYDPSPQPLFIRKIRGGGTDTFDMNLDVFCYRQ